MTPNEIIALVPVIGFVLIMFIAGKGIWDRRL